MLTIDNGIVRKNGRKIGTITMVIGGWEFTHARSKVYLRGTTRDDVLVKVMDRYL